MFLKPFPLFYHLSQHFPLRNAIVELLIMLTTLDQNGAFFESLQAMKRFEDINEKCSSL